MCVEKKGIRVFFEVIVRSFFHVVDGVAAGRLVNEECFVRFYDNDSVSGCERALRASIIVDGAMREEYDGVIFREAYCEEGVRRGHVR